MEKEKLSERDINLLKRYVAGILKDDADKMDVHAEVDRSLTIGENKTILLEKIQPLLNTEEKMERGIILQPAKEELKKDKKKLDKEEKEEEVIREEEIKREEEQKFQDIIKENKLKYENISNQELKQQIINAQNTEIDEIAEHLNKSIDIGFKNWLIILYSTLSLNCPKISTSTGLKYNIMPTLLAGEISTAKSCVIDIIQRLFTNTISYSEFTKASFVGIADKDSIDVGIVDELKDKVLLIKEFDYIDIPFQREFLEGSLIRISKGGHKKEIYPNTVLICASNPKSDWWLKEKMNLQLKTADGDLSRFSFILPLVNDKDKNEKILDDMDIFCEYRKDNKLDEFGTILATIMKSMKTVKKIELTEEQKIMIKNAYKTQNKLLNGVRPNLLILRDFEHLLKFVCVIVTTNVLKKGEKERIKADDDEVKKAIELWEHSIDLKNTLYCSEERIILTIEDKIYKKMFELKRGEAILVTELEKEIVKEDEFGNPTKDLRGNPIGLCSRATMYRAVQRLILESKLKVLQNKPMMVVPI